MTIPSSSCIPKFHERLINIPDSKQTHGHNPLATDLPQVSGRWPAEVPHLRFAIKFHWSLSGERVLWPSPKQPQIPSCRPCCFTDSAVSPASSPDIEEQDNVQDNWRKNLRTYGTPWRSKSTQRTSKASLLTGAVASVSSSGLDTSTLTMMATSNQ